MLVAAGADINAKGGDGKDSLGLAIFNGGYDVASFLIDNHANVNQPDAQRFTPLFWAVDRRNMETAPNFPWVVTADPLALDQKASRCRRQREFPRQQHASRTHARRFTSHRVCDGIDARRILWRCRTGETPARAWRRSEDRFEGQ